MRVPTANQALAGIAAAAITASSLPLTSEPVGLALNITAINGRHGASVLQCWRLKHTFSQASIPGTIGALNLDLGDFSGVSYTILPSQFDGGTHNAPMNQFVYFISGLAHISLPTSDDEVWVQGGKHGLIAAVDTVDVSASGHITRYPGIEDTLALQLPLENWSAANYTLLHDGPCTSAEMAAL